MIVFPNTKINLGLNIISKRNDGYHNIQTVFYPINYNDILEIVEDKKFSLITEGLEIDCPTEKNLCSIAYNLIKSEYNIPAVKIILYKNVPYGTGLGSASSNAAHTLLLLNEIFNLKISENELINIASKIGADCAFFIRNKPVFAEGKGNIFSDINVSFNDYYLTICFPDFKISTKEAYNNCTPKKSDISLKKIIKKPIKEWKNHLYNDFENIIFEKHTILSKIKEKLYNFGTIYAQMSGSGSAIFGIFDKNPGNIKIKNCRTINIKL